MSEILILAAVVLMGPVVVGAIRPSDAGPVRESGLRRLTALSLALALASAWTTASLLVPPIAVCGVLVALLATALCVRKRSNVSSAERLDVVVAPRAPRALVALASVAFAVAGAVLVLRLARRPDGEWDAYAIWNLRARLLVREPGDLSTFAIGAHPDYPLLLPGLVAAGWTLTGDGAAWVSGAIAWLFAAIAAGGIAAVVRPRRGSSMAILAALAYVAMPWSSVPWRYADVPISAFLVLAVGWLASAYEQPSRARSAVALAGLCASLAAWTKNEGAVHVAALGLVLLLRPPTGVPRRRAMACFFGAALPLLAVLVAFKVGLAPESEYVAESTPTIWFSRLGDGSRYVTIARHVWEELTRRSHWNFLLPTAILLVGFLPRRRSADIPVARSVGLVALAYAGIYLVSPHPLDWQLTWSLDRLLLQLCPALLVALALRVAPPLSAAESDSLPSD